jgi:propionyl-CoA carboxylase alpha chain
MPTTNKNKAQPILTAPLSGMIVKIFVKPGEEVKAGQKLLIIEAMKMENVICAEHTSKITSINVAEKEQVAVGAVIIEFEV